MKRIRPDDSRPDHDAPVPDDRGTDAHVETASDAGAAVDAAPYAPDNLPPRDADLAVPADAAPGPAPVDIAAAVAAAGLGGPGRPGEAGGSGDGGGSGEAGPSSGAGKPGGAGTGGAARARPAPAKSPKRPAAPSRRQRRRYARERAVQALYQWHMTGASSSDVRREFLATQDMGRVDVEYFEDAFRGVTLTPSAIDDELAGVLDRDLAEVDPIERAILRLATWELRSRPDTPALVVINEGVEIAKRFCAEPGHRYVNGVLDRLATLLRATEMPRA